MFIRIKIIDFYFYCKFFEKKLSCLVLFIKGLDQFGLITSNYYLYFSYIFGNLFKVWFSWELGKKGFRKYSIDIGSQGSG